MAKIIRASKGSPQELEMLVENRIAELEDRDITSSFVYPDDLEDLENGEYESHVTEPINCSAIVRPVGYKSWGVYLPDGHNHAEKLFESESEDECYDWINDNQKVIWEKEAAMNTVEGASGSPQELQMLVENRLDRLESGVDASFVYPEDLIDLENGEYESHVTEPINAATDFKKLASDVLKFLANKGFDIASNSVRKYADAVAEYIEQAREHTNYSIEEWYKETKHNYPEDLRELPKVTAAEGIPGIDFDDDEDESFEDRYKPDVDAIVDWLWEHPQAYSDACHHFRVPKLHLSDGVDWDDLAAYADADAIIDWIADHPQLAEDFGNEFGHEWIEGCTNTANIMSAIDMTTPVEPDMLPAYIANLEGYLYTLFTDRYTCIRDVEAVYQGKNSSIRVTIIFEPDAGEDDMHTTYAASVMPENSQAAAYKIYVETIEDWGDELADTERIFETTL